MKDLSRDELEREVERLRASELRYRCMVEASPSSILVVQNGVIVFANPVASRRLGFDPPDDVLGVAVLDIIAEAQHDEIRQRLDSVEAGETTAPAEIEIVTLAGERLQIDTRWAPTTWDGRPAVLVIGRDVTDWKSAEQALQRSETRFRTSFDASAVAMAVVGPNGEFLSVNPAACRMLGYSTTEFAARSFADVTHPDDIEQSTTQFRQCLKDREAYTIDKRYLAKNGETRVGLTTVSPIFDANGAFSYAVAHLQDITERTALAERLSAERRKSRRLLDTMINAFVIFDSVFDDDGVFVSYRFVYINRAYEEITGVTLEEVRGRTVHEVWPETEASWVERYGAAAVTGETQRFEMYHEPTGKHYNCAAYRPWDTTDRFCVVFEDVTHRRRAEEALRASEEKYRTLFENMAQGAFVQLADGALVDCNPAALTLFGLTRDQFLGRTSMRPEWRIVREDGSDLPGEQHPSMRALTTGEPVRDELIGVFNPERHDLVWMSVNANPIFNPGEPTPHAVFVTLHDVTEQRRLEASLRSLAVELSAVEERERRELATYLHDHIGQTLAVLRMRFGDVSRRLGASELGDRVESMRDLLERAIDETQSLTFELSPPVLYELGLEPALEWLGEKICSEHDLAFEFTDDGRHKPLGPDIAPLLFRSVRELLYNVVKHAGASAVELSVTQATGTVRVTLRDNGVGFEPGALAPAVESTRFGLFSVSERLAAVGGRMAIDSAPARGTRVTLEAPVATGASPGRKE